MNRFSSFSDAELLKNAGVKLNNDYFIFLKGAEDRAYSVLEKYYEMICPKKIIMIDSRLKNESLTAEDMQKYNSVDSLLSEKGISTIKTISIEDSNIGKSLAGEEITESSTVAIDISSMNFWELSGLLYYLFRIVSVQQVDLFYTEPGLYHYEDNNISQYAYKEAKVSVNYIKSYFSTKTTEDEVLVSLLGFQKHVNKLMKDLFEISGHYSVNGFPSFYPKANDISQVNNADYLSEIEPANRYSAEATNPFITYNTLVDIRKATHGAFMNICPMCSKPMAVGACLYALNNPDTTRIVYPYEETIMTKSDGIGHTHCYSINKSLVASERPE